MYTICGSPCKYSVDGTARVQNFEPGKVALRNTLDSESLQYKPGLFRLDCHICIQSEQHFHSLRVLMIHKYVL